MVLRIEVHLYNFGNVIRYSWCGAYAWIYVYIDKSLYMLLVMVAALAHCHWTQRLGWLGCVSLILFRRNCLKWHNTQYGLYTYSLLTHIFNIHWHLGFEFRVQCLLIWTYIYEQFCLTILQQVEGIGLKTSIIIMVMTKADTPTIYERFSCLGRKQINNLDEYTEQKF